MDDLTIKVTNMKRLAGWEGKLNEDHSTPIAMVACGHDHKAGTVTIHVPDDISISQAATILEGAAAGLRAGKLKLN